MMLACECAQQGGPGHLVIYDDGPFCGQIAVISSLAMEGVVFLRLPTAGLRGLRMVWADERGVFGTVRYRPLSGRICRMGHGKTEGPPHHHLWMNDR